MFYFLFTIILIHGETVIDIPILSLEDKAEDEIYDLIDKHLKPLPKNNDGAINKEAKGFNTTM